MPVKVATGIRKVSNRKDLEQVMAAYNRVQASYSKRILVCGGAGCISSHCEEVKQALELAVMARGLENEVTVLVTGCMGACAMGPAILMEPDGVFYTKLNADKVSEIIDRHVLGGEVVEEYTFFDPVEEKYLARIDDIDFFSEQVRIALRNCGRMDYSALEAYIARDGYFALAKALEGEPATVVETLKQSGLRGRGGAGFPTGIKWEAAMKASSPDGRKYMVCNADEGDPGAFMDRSILEGDPHSVIEGMLLGGYAIGAQVGYIYVRAEYPLAIERLEDAIAQARAAGLLGGNILSSSFSFDLEIRIGAGAFVCGEETSLIASIEGRRGEPRQKPPFPFESGLYGRPTNINNVETLANIAPIVLRGGQWYREHGTEKSPGTKVFALAGDIVNTGIIEVPMGIALGDIIYKIGGGVRGGKRFKAIQSGGPSGGCLTRAHMNVRVDYESLAELGAIMGSGGLVVMSEDTCMVDTARYFLDFIRDESCGKCLPCRVGTKRMLEILERITGGQGQEGDIELLESLAATLKDAAMCGLGQTAANPVLSTLRYFREEYETHIREGHCVAGVCAELQGRGVGFYSEGVRVEFQASPCRNACPANVFVPGYLSLVASGRLEEAYHLIRQENPFPAVCGRICTHPCEQHCRREQVDEAVGICSIKRFIGDYALRDEYLPPSVKPLPPTGKRVAIIGAGPSGLTCAHYLAHLGHEVDVYEAESVAGGALYWGVPEFRLPKDVLAKEIGAIENAGVRIHLRTRVGKEIAFEEMQKQSDAVYISIGTQKARLLNIPGEDARGVESGLQFMRRVNLDLDRRVAKRLVVIGGGSTAMDCARTALRLGAEEVTVVYRRTESQMLASRQEIDEALEEGVRLLPLAAPVEILENNGKVSGVRLQRCEMADYDRDGRRRSVPVQGSAFEIPCEGVMTAINQDVDTAFYKEVDMDLSKNGSLKIDKFTSQTSQQGIFAGGDASPWNANVLVTAIADGKLAAVNIDKYLGGDGVLNKGGWIEIPEIEDYEVTEPHMRFAPRTLDVESRRGCFDEVELGYHKLDAMAESLRCLHCDRR